MQPPLPPVEIARQLVGLRHAPQASATLARSIYDTLLRESPRLLRGNFSCIASADLARLFDLYDEHLFAGRVQQLLQAVASPLSFQLSARLTRSAGTTKRFVPRGLAPAGAAASAARYEIAISTTLLFQTFQDVERTIRVNGLVCHDRLEALQRIFEHEVLHLIEMLVWGRSSCSAANFKALAWNYFGHTETSHDLITQQERAHAKFDMRVGDRVGFEFEGKRYKGMLNRITKRATVLVESADGTIYTDGKSYRKFYVPLALLEKIT